MYWSVVCYVLSQQSVPPPVGWPRGYCPCYLDTEKGAAAAAAAAVVVDAPAAAAAVTVDAAAAAVAVDARKAPPK